MVTVFMFLVAVALHAREILCLRAEMNKVFPWKIRTVCVLPKAARMVHVWIFGEYLVEIHDACEMYRSAELGRTQLLVLQAVQTTAMSTANVSTTRVCADQAILVLPVST